MICALHRRKRQQPSGPSFVFFANPRSCGASKFPRNGIGTDMANFPPFASLNHMSQVFRNVI
jgi:hypothetical protein